MQATILPYMVLTAGICLLAVSIYLFGSKKRPVLGKSRALLLVPLLGIVCALSPLIAEAKTVHPKATGDSTTYYVCGDETTLTGLWNAASPNQYISDPAGYWGYPVSYTGIRGYGTGSNPYCSGIYFWTMNGTPHTATWVWYHADLNGYDGCRVSVHIPSWYAGTPDANYSLWITSHGVGGASGTTVNQNLQSAGWIDLTQIGYRTLPPSSDGIYDLTLTLTNGTQTPWYLGADAVAFTCSAPSVNWF